MYKKRSLTDATSIQKSICMSPRENFTIVSQRDFLANKITIPARILVRLMLSGFNQTQIFSCSFLMSETSNNFVIKIY